MKIAVTAKGRTLDDPVDPRFGRCQYFLIVDTETLHAEPVENPNLALGSGAGIQSAQLLARNGVQVVLTGNCGPNAYQTLNAANVKVVVGVRGTTREVVEQFKSGTLSSTQGPNVISHFGVGADTRAQAPEERVSGMGGGAGMGRGMGGGGRGMGQGMGRGMGMGGGRGMGQGMTTGGGMSGVPFTQPAEAGFPASPNAGGETDTLKAEAQRLEVQLQALRSRIAQMDKGRAQRRLLAVVAAEKCTACGLCQEVCPTGAIRIERTAIVDAGKCTGCGQCVTECPEDALTLKKG